MREPHRESAYPPPSQKTSLQGIPIYLYFHLVPRQDLQGIPIYFLPSSCFQTRSSRHPNLLFLFPCQNTSARYPKILQTTVGKFKLTNMLNIADLKLCQYQLQPNATELVWGGFGRPIFALKSNSCTLHPDNNMGDNQFFL